MSLVRRLLPVRLVNFAMPGSALFEHLDALDFLDGRLGAPSVCVFAVFLGNDLTEIADDLEPEHGADASTTPLSSWLSAANRALDEHWMLRRWYGVQWARALTVRAGQWVAAGAAGAEHARVDGSCRRARSPAPCF